MNFSNLESALLGLRVGRLPKVELGFLEEQLEGMIKEGKFDICRVKIDANSEKLFYYLNNLGFPYDIYNVNFYNLLKLPKDTAFDTLDFKVRRVEDGAKDEEFKTVLMDVLRHKTWMEYHTKLGNTILSDELKLDLAFNFYQNTKGANHYCSLLYKGDEPIGLYMGEFKSNVFFGTLFGVINKYRKQGYAKYFYRFMYQECAKRKVDFFETEVNLFNFASQQSALSQNFVPQSVHYNLTIYPFLNINNKQAVELKLGNKSLQGIIAYYESLQGFKFKGTIRVKRHQEYNGQGDKVVSSFFIKRENYYFLAAHIFKENVLVESVYLDSNNI